MTIFQQSRWTNKKSLRRDPAEALEQCQGGSIVSTSIGGWGLNGETENVSRYIGLTASWCHAMDGRSSIIDGMREIGRAFDAASVSLSKVSIVDGGKSINAKIETASSRAVQIDRSYARDVLGFYVDSAKIGSIWSVCHFAKSDVTGINQLRQNYGINDILIITLGREGKWSYFLEIFLSHRVGRNTASSMLPFAKMCSQTWLQRKSGLFSELVLDKKELKKDPIALGEVLSPENPNHLSRAEFRVCVLLSRGLDKEEILNELGIKNSTLRIHLRHIFAKTTCRCFSDLCKRLLLEAQMATRFDSRMTRRSHAQY